MGTGAMGIGAMSAAYTGTDDARAKITTLATEVCFTRHPNCLVPLGWHFSAMVKQ
jgi:hypothetical protein